MSLRDAYLSVAEALAHGGYENNAEVEIRWIQAEDVEEQERQPCWPMLTALLYPAASATEG